MEVFYGILLPFLGTSLGAACVFFMKKSLSDRVQRALTGSDVVLITPEESLRLKDGARFDLTAQRTDGRLYRLGATGAVRLRRGVGQQWQTP